MQTQNKRLMIMLLAVVFILLIPLVAMQFTSEVDWSPLDFLIMGSLLSFTALLCEMILRKVKTVRLRVILCVATLAALFLIWAELAVGIFGTPFAGS
ncbi:MAG: hypothetical protein H6555_02725 [Lewinellaceae bacterium]|nr:hypothetical protein [Lewinellaceae bacterium]